MSRAMFKLKISKAMEGNYSMERLNKIYETVMDAEKRLIYPEVNVDIRADFFILACGYANHDYYEEANQLYHAFDGIRRKQYTEEQLINAVKKRLQLRKIFVDK